VTVGIIAASVSEPWLAAGVGPRRKGREDDVGCIGLVAATLNDVGALQDVLLVISNGRVALDRLAFEKKGTD
jgi:hypothetical protein